MVPGHRQVGLLSAITSRATIRQDASASDGWLNFYTYANSNTCTNEAEWYNEKSDVIRPYCNLMHRNRSTSSTMYCVICKLNVSMHAHRPILPLPVVGKLSGGEM